MELSINTVHTEMIFIELDVISQTSKFSLKKFPKFFELRRNTEKPSLSNIIDFCWCFYRRNTEIFRMKIWIFFSGFVVWVCVCEFSCSLFSLLSFPMVLKNSIKKQKLNGKFEKSKTYRCKEKHLVILNKKKF